MSENNSNETPGAGTPPAPALPTIIKPSVGRVIWYWPYGKDGYRQPHAAQIAYVWGDRLVNISAIDENGVQYARTSVPLVQPGDEDSGVTYGSNYAEWMPFQVGQAQAQAIPVPPFPEPR